MFDRFPIYVTIGMLADHIHSGVNCSTVTYPIYTQINKCNRWAGDLGGNTLRKEMLRYSSMGGERSYLTSV